MVRTVPREFDWEAMPEGHRGPNEDHSVAIEVKGRGVRCTCLAQAQALAAHPENNRSSYGVLPGPRVPGPALPRNKVDVVTKAAVDDLDLSALK